MRATAEPRLPASERDAREQADGATVQSRVWTRVIHADRTGSRFEQTRLAGGASWLLGDWLRRPLLAPFYEGLCQGHGPRVVEGAATLLFCRV